MGEDWTICADRIKGLLDERNIKQRELAEKIGCTEVSIGRYLKPDRIPNATVLIAIAKALNASIDGIAGLSDDVDPKQTRSDGFWPCAITTDDQRLFTCDSASSEDQCIGQFEIWENHYGYNIDKAWIEHGGSKTYFTKKWVEVEQEDECCESD